MQFSPADLTRREADNLIRKVAGHKCLIGIGGHNPRTYEAVVVHTGIAEIGWYAPRKGRERKEWMTAMSRRIDLITVVD